MARVEYPRAFAGGYQALRDQGVEALVLESHCRYVVPARFDDVLRVHTRCVDVRGARFRYEYAIVRDDGVLMADGYTSHACVDASTFAPTRVPDWLRDAIASVESSSESSRSSS
jgi:acyl-CoA thioester hydrolase